MIQRFKKSIRAFLWCFPALVFFFFGAAQAFALSASASVSPSTIYPDTSYTVNATVSNSSSGPVGVYNFWYKDGTQIGGSCWGSQAIPPNASNVSISPSCPGTTGSGGTYRLDVWANDWSGILASASVSVSITPQPVTATFNISASAGTGGSVSCPNCGSSVSAGTAVTATAFPDSGYEFSSWTGGTCGGTGTNPCSFSASGSQSMTANFTLSPASFSLSDFSVCDASSGGNCGSTIYGNGSGYYNVTITNSGGSSGTFSGYYTLFGGRWTGMDISQMVSGLSSVPYTKSNISGTGTYTIGACRSDGSGCVGGGSVTFLGAPSLGGPSSVTTGNSVTFTVSYDAAIAPSFSARSCGNGGSLVSSSGNQFTCAYTNGGSSAFQSQASVKITQGSASRTVTLFITVNPVPPFNYSLGNSGAASVTLGSSATVPITSSLTSGTGQAVTLSASGLPSGMTASFSPNPVTPPGSSTLTLSASKDTAPGTYPITVTGSPLGKTTSSTVSVSVPAPQITRATSQCTLSGKLSYHTANTIAWNAATYPSGTVFNIYIAPGETGSVNDFLTSVSVSSFTQQLRTLQTTTNVQPPFPNSSYNGSIDDLSYKVSAVVNRIESGKSNYAYLTGTEDADQCASRLESEPALPPKLPNLTPTTPTVTGTAPVPGKTNTFYAGSSITLSANVSNDSVRTIAETFQNRFRYTTATGAGDASGDLPLSNIAMGGSKSVSATIANVVAGIFTLFLRADTSGTVAESNEGDNDGAGVAITIENPSAVATPTPSCPAGEDVIASFVTPGSQTWTVPAGLGSARVKIWGGGGGGGCGTDLLGGGVGGCGRSYGGGGGGYTEKVLSLSAPSYSITVGGGGKGQLASLMSSGGNVLRYASQGTNSNFGSFTAYGSGRQLPGNAFYAGGTGDTANGGAGGQNNQNMGGGGGGGGGGSAGADSPSFSSGIPALRGSGGAGGSSGGRGGDGAGGVPFLGGFQDCRDAQGGVFPGGGGGGPSLYFSPPLCGSYQTGGDGASGMVLICGVVQPDLTAGAPALSDAYGHTGAVLGAGVVTINGTITNAGGAATPNGTFKNRYEYRKFGDTAWTALPTVLLSDTASGISAGGSRATVSASWTGTAGTWEFRLTADSDNAVTESNDGNNISSITKVDVVDFTPTLTANKPKVYQMCPVTLTPAGGKLGPTFPGSEVVYSAPQCGGGVTASPATLPANGVFTCTYLLPAAYSTGITGTYFDRAKSASAPVTVVAAVPRVSLYISDANGDCLGAKNTGVQIMKGSKTRLCWRVDPIDCAKTPP